MFTITECVSEFYDVTRETRAEFTLSAKPYEKQGNISETSARAFGVGPAAGSRIRVVKYAADIYGWWRAARRAHTLSGGEDSKARKLWMLQEGETVQEG